MIRWVVVAFVACEGLFCSTARADEPSSPPPVVDAATEAAPPAQPEVPAAPMAPAAAPAAEAAPPAVAALPCPPPPCAPACEVCSPCWEPCACAPCRGLGIEVQGHVTWISPIEGPITEDSGRADQAVWDVLEREPEFGYRVEVDIPLPWCCFWLTPAFTDWGCLRETDDQLATIAVRATPTSPLVVSPPHGISTAADSQLWEIDLMAWRDALCKDCARLGWGAGFKYISFHEQAAFGFTEANVVSAIEGDVTNDFYGIEVGGHAGVRAGPFELLFEAGAFGGVVHQEAHIDFSTIGGTAGPRVTADDFAWGVEATVSTRFRLGSHLFLSTGVEGMALFDFARAERVFDFTQVATGTVPARLVEDTVFAVRVFVGIGFEF